MQVGKYASMFLSTNVIILQKKNIFHAPYQAEWKVMDLVVVKYGM